jgi:hypothetical protein
MRYLWGYSRPSAQQGLATIYLAHVRPEQAEALQQRWLELLRRQAIQPVLASSFLARGAREGVGERETRGLKAGSLFLSLLSWSGETDQEDFYADASFHSLILQLNNSGSLQTLRIDQP